MTSPHKPEVLQIKKYPNRRYYDATRSCHITLHEIYGLIVAGHDVVIVDSRTGEDITNLVLLQVLLEQDQPKLDLFPAAVLHMMIRSNRQVVRTLIDRTFGPFLKMMATSRKQWDTYWRSAMSGQLVSPLDWADSMMQAFAGNREPDPGGTDEPPGVEWPEEGSGDAPAAPAPQAVDELRAQVALLNRRIEALTAQLSDREQPRSAKQRGSGKAGTS